MASPLILEVTRSIDDNCEVNNGNSNNATLAYIRLDASVPYGSVMFNVDASELKGQTITSATFRLKGHTAGGLTLNARVYGDAADAPTDNNTAGSYNISTRTKTTAYTTITGTLNSSTYSEWDISNVIQELADNPDWDGTIFLILHRQANECYAGSYDGSRPPQLDITYTGGGDITTTQTIQGKSRITKVVGQTILGRSRITKSVSQTILGRSRIQKSVSRTITGISKIQTAVTRAITGKANIRANTSRTVTGKSSILKAAQRTILGRSRITKSVSQTILGKANIATAANRTITGKGSILTPTIKTITGKANINAATQRTITGKARIVGVTEFRIDNNLIVDSDRETWLPAIYNALNGIEFHPFKSDTGGLGYFEPGDRVLMKDPSENEYEVLVMDCEINLTGGMKEIVNAKIPAQTKTNYDYAGIIGQRIKHAEIIVNKQDGRIDLIVSDLSENYFTRDETTAQISLTTDSIVSSVQEISTQVNTAISQGETNADAIALIQSNITEITQTAEALAIKVASSGGTNLLRNSVGLKGDLVDWQVLSDGVLVDADNDGTIDQTADVVINTESGSAINIQEQYIQQTFATIEDQQYTLYLRYKSTDDTDVNITGVVGDIVLPQSTNWVVYKYQFTATGPSTTFVIDNRDYSGSSSTVSDIVIKLGDASGWIQAPNEVYGKNFKFDKEGFSITSLTDPFKSLLDNTKLAVYDTSGGVDRIVALFSKDEGKITKLTAQEEFVLRRYENSASSMRMIPTETGIMLVIND